MLSLRCKFQTFNPTMSMDHRITINQLFISRKSNVYFKVCDVLVKASTKQQWGSWSFALMSAGKQLHHPLLKPVCVKNGKEGHLFIYLYVTPTAWHKCVNWSGVQGLAVQLWAAKEWAVFGYLNRITLEQWQDFDRVEFALWSVRPKRLKWQIYTEVSSHKVQILHSFT